MATAGKPSSSSSFRSEPQSLTALFTSRHFTPLHCLLLIFILITNTQESRFKQNSISGYYSLDKLRHQKCKEKPLDVREENADIIFTGTVKSLEPDTDTLGKDSAIPSRGGGSLQLAQVEVKRVLKGSNILEEIPVVYTTGNYLLSQRRMVLLGGVGRTDVCVGDARLHDTSIFFARLDKERDRLVLNASLLRLTLDNIAKTEAAIKGIVE